MSVERILTKMYVGLVTRAQIAAGRGLSFPSFSLLTRVVSLFRLMLAGKHWRTQAQRMEAAKVRRKPGHQAPTQREDAGVKPGDDTWKMQVIKLLISEVMSSPDLCEETRENLP